MPNKKISLALLYGAVLLIALNGLFAKLIPLDAITITQLRSVIAVFVLFLFCLIQKKTMRLPGIKRGIGIYLLGILLGLHWATFFHSMQVSSVAVGILSLFSFPVITVLLEPWFANHRPQIADIFAAIIVFFGLFIMVSPELKTMQGEIIQGVFWGVLSALLYSIRNIIQKYYFADIGSNNLMFHQVIATSLMFLLFVDLQSTFAMSPESWLMLFLLGILCTAAAHTLLVYNMKVFPVKTVAMISCFQPLLASIFAWLVIGEIPQTSVFIGGSLIIAVALYESVKSNKN